MATTPNTNMDTANNVSNRYTHISLSNGRTEDGNVPPVGHLLVYGHEASVDIRLLG